MFSPFFLVEKDSEKTRVTVFSMPIVAACFNELIRLSHYYSLCHGIVGYSKGLIKLISEMWEGIVSELDSKLCRFGASLLRLPAYSGEESGAAMATEFLELLLMGTPSAETQNFLLRDLGEKGLKKLIASVDQSYVNISRLVLKYLAGMSQSLCAFLGELHGIVMADPKVIMEAFSLNFNRSHRDFAFNSLSWKQL